MPYPLFLLSVEGVVKGIIVFGLYVPSATHISSPADEALIASWSAVYAFDQDAPLLDPVASISTYIVAAFNKDEPKSKKNKKVNCLILIISKLRLKKLLLTNVTK